MTQFSAPYAGRGPITEQQWTRGGPVQLPAPRGTRGHGNTSAAAQSNKGKLRAAASAPSR